MRTPRDRGWLPQAQKARAKRQTRSIGNVTAANLARTCCVAVATSSSDGWRSNGIFHGVRRALNLWAASGALVAAFVLGWLRRHNCCVIAIDAGALSPDAVSYPMANGAACIRV